MLLRQCVELLVGVGELLAPLDTLSKRLAHLVPLLHASRLHGEVDLRRSDLWFARIAIHSKEIAAKAREEIILDFALCPFAKSDHLRGASKMILHFLPRIATCCFGPFDKI